jgi:anti-anti-sigma regulatory factor
MDLRIEKTVEREQVVFTLSGRIREDKIAELQELMRCAEPDRGIVFDLKEVRLVDRDVVRFLAQIEEDGARLRHCSSFIREWISQERCGMHDTDKGDGELSRTKRDMWVIQLAQQRPHTIVVLLNGRIQADVIPRLRKVWTSAHSDYRVVLELKDARIVDRDVVRFLAQIERDGARLKHCSWFIREWILQERDGMQRHENG